MRKDNQAVSIIIPAFNDQLYVRFAVQSVLKQDVHNMTVHVVDDASRDNTVESVRELAKDDRRIVLHSLAYNRGPAIARNIGLSASTDRYVAFLDADDYWYPGKLAAQLQTLHEHASPICCTAYDVLDRRGRLSARFVPPPTVSYDHLLYTCPIGTSTVVVDRGITGEFSMPDIRRAQDYATWLQLTRRYGPAVCVQEPLAAYRTLPGSVSRNKLRKAYYQFLVYRKHEKFSLRRSLRYMLSYTVSGLTKYRKANAGFSSPSDL